MDVGCRKLGKVESMEYKRRMKKEYTEKELEYIKKLMSNGMDRVRSKWYLNAMQTWTKEDYEDYDKFHMEMMGSGPTEEDLEELRKI